MGTWYGFYILNTWRIPTLGPTFSIPKNSARTSFLFRKAYLGVCWFFWIYNFFIMSFCYVILALNFTFCKKINIITLYPTETEMRYKFYINFYFEKREECN